MNDWFHSLRDKLRPLGPTDTFDEHSIAAGVLIPIGLNAQSQKLEILLTKRTDVVETHKNEVGFPGGIYSPEDRGLLLNTALRETEEEIGVKSADLELLGQLAPVPTLFKVKIFPFVARMQFPYPFRLNDAEVAKLIHLPMDRLLTEGLSPVEVAVEGSKIKSIGLEFEGELIWGASAKILEELRELLLA